jgi:SSS family solute:Na+ symporter
MELLDWLIVLTLLACIFFGNTKAAAERKSVADFLAANRSVGQYLLAVGEGTAGLGAVTVVAYLERGYTAGFVPTYWALAQTPLDIFIRVTGFVRYRYRMTKAMTMAQFFEMRCPSPQ